MIRQLKRYLTSKDPINRVARRRGVVIIAGVLVGEALGWVCNMVGRGGLAIYFYGATWAWGLASIVWIMMWSSDVMALEQKHHEELMRLDATHAANMAAIQTAMMDLYAGRPRSGDAFEQRFDGDAGEL